MPASIELGDRQALVRNAVDLDRAPVGRRHAAQDLHQGRFAGAVFADQADHLAAAARPAEIGQRHDAGIGLRNPDQSEERLASMREGTDETSAADMLDLRGKSGSREHEPEPAGKWYRRPAAGSASVAQLLLEIGLELRRHCPWSMILPGTMVDPVRRNDRLVAIQIGGKHLAALVCPLERLLHDRAGEGALLDGAERDRIFVERDRP